MLTTTEQAACRTAPCTREARHGYGHPAIGACPIAAVAVLRGATLYVHPETGYYSFTDLQLHPSGSLIDRAGGRDLIIADQAERDVLAWAGFRSLRAFLDALRAHGAAIFPAEALVAV